MNHMMYNGAMARFPFAGGIFFIVFLALVALVVILFIKNRKLKKNVGTTGGANALTKISATDNANNPEAILKERLSKGEIDEEEFDKLLLKIKA